MTNPYLDDDGQYRPLRMSPVAQAHPAYAAARASWRLANTKDKAGWLACWSPEGCLEDPVGPSMFDMEGSGHRGLAGLTAFWDMAIALPEHIEFRFDRAVACGDELLCTGALRTHIGGQVMDAVGGVNYRVDSSGLLVSLRAFWETESSLATLRPDTDGPTENTVAKNPAEEA